MCLNNETAHASSSKIHAWSNNYYFHNSVSKSEKYAVVLGDFLFAFSPIVSLKRKTTIHFRVLFYFIHLFIRFTLFHFLLFDAPPE